MMSSESVTTYCVLGTSSASGSSAAVRVVASYVTVTAVNGVNVMLTGETPKTGSVNFTVGVIPSGTPFAFSGGNVSTTNGQKSNASVPASPAHERFACRSQRLGS